MSIARAGSRQKPLGAEAGGVVRTLAILEALNVHAGATVTELHASSGISRPAIYRILEALIEAGFVAAGRIPRTYILTSKVRSLSRGFTDDHLIAEVAAPILDQLQKKVIWPTEIATLQDFRMHLRDTTRHLSPMVIDGEVVGRGIPLLSTALGLAYLSHCAPLRRQEILAHLRAGVGSSDPYPGDRRVSQLLEDIRARGYAWRESGLLEGFRYQTSTIAVPIRIQDDARAALAVTFFSSAMSVEQAARRYLGDLQGSGRMIEKKLKQVLGEKRRPSPTGRA
jgi:IclR family transcriptional regulator, mhp operon transcriptional activator